MEDRAGYTLAELFIALALVATMIMLALPGLGNWRQRNDAEAVTGLLQQALTAARSASLLNASNITLCPAGNALQCGHDWSSGLLLLGAQDKVLLHHHWNLPPGTVHWRGSGNRNRLRFAPGGMPLEYGSFEICIPGGAPRRLIINRRGRVRVHSPADPGAAQGQEPSRC